MNILLKNCRIYDGTGNQAYSSDILIKNDRIEKIAEGIEEDGCEVRDLKGLSVAPGFIDAHSHNDWFTFRKDKLRFFAPFLEQGITTQVTGNCGFSPFGHEKDTENLSLIGSGLFSKEECGEDTSTLEGYIAASGDIPVNIYPILGHMSSRISLAGYENRPLTEEELDRQDALLRRELDMGANGISLGLMYEPDRYAPYEELKRAANIAKEYSRPLTVHARALSSVSTSYGIPFGGKPHNLRALDEMLELVRDTGVDMQFSHLIFVGSKTWKTADKALEEIDNINKEGYRFFYDSYSMFCGASVITVVLPSWYLSLDEKKRGSLISRLRLALEVNVSKLLLGFNFKDIRITWAGEEYSDITGMTVHEIAKKWGMSDLKAYAKLVNGTGGTANVLMYRYLNEDILKKLMADEKCLYMTDAWYEEKGMQNPATYSSFPEFLRIARKEGKMAETVRKMTGAAADRFNMADRGYIKLGAFADIVVFDADTVSAADDFNGSPTGIISVMVNGEWAVDGGKAMDRKGSGRFILAK